MGIFSSIGKGLGFSGKGGGFMKGMGNVSSLMSMLGGGGGDEQGGPQANASPINSGVGGFELDNYVQPVQGFADGGVPNQGKPAIIVDEETGQPTGRMNEEEPEFVVPAEQVPEATRNMTVNPDTSMPMQTEPKDELEDINDLKQYKKSVFPTKDDKANETKGEHDKKETIRIDKKETGIAPKDGTQMKDVIRTLARMTGYYYDMRKNRYGLGKSALTMYLDNLEGHEAQTAKNKATTSASIAKTTQEGKDKTAELDQRHKNKMAEIEAGKKGDKAQSLEKEKMRVREEASEDWDNLGPTEKEKFGDTPEGKKNYINDRLNIAIESKVPEYKKEITTERKRTLRHPIAKEDITTEEDIRTGKYVPSENTGGEEQKLKVMKVNKGKGLVLLSDNTTMTIKEAKKKGLM